MFSISSVLCALSTQETIATIVTAVVVVLGLAAIVLFSKNKGNTSKVVTYGAVSVALSFALSYVKLPLAPGGTGSVTLASSVPLVIYAFYFGTGAGAVAGVLNGLLQFLQNPYFLTPLQFMLDYILAFGSPFIAGVIGRCIKNSKIGLPASAAAAGLVRLIMHTLAGIIFYMEWQVPELAIFGSTENMGALIYSLLYNALYMIPEILIAVVVTVPISSSKELRRLMSRASLRAYEEQDK